MKKQKKIERTSNVIAIRAPQELLTAIDTEKSRRLAADPKDKSSDKDVLIDWLSAHLGITFTIVGRGGPRKHPELYADKSP